MWQGIIVIVCVLQIVTSQNDATAEFERIVKDFWDWRLRESPEYGTKYGLYVYEDQVEEYTEAAFQRRKQKADELFSRLESIGEAKLGGQDQISYAVLKSLLESFRMGYEFRHYGPLNPINSMESPISEWKKYIAWMKKSTIEDFENILSRLDKVPNQINQFVAFLNKSIEKKTTDHEKSMAGVLDSFNKIVATPAENTFFYAPFKNIPSSIDKGNATNLQARARSAVNKIRNVFRFMKGFVENTYMKNLRPNIAAVSLPNGLNYYKACLKWHLSMELSPEEVHQKGLDEVNAVAAKIEKIMKAKNFQGSIKEYIQKLNSNPDNFYKTEDEVLNGYRDLIKNKIRGKLGMVLPIKSVPHIKLIVEKSDNIHGATGRYTEPPVDGSRPGIFIANVYEPEKRPKYNMLALALHEAEPGHHTQASYNYGNDLPLFRRLIEYRKYYAAPYNWPFFTAYVEGWGLYSEALGEDMGLYETSDDLFGRYSSEIHRAARLVVDTGLHYYNWTYEKAEEYMKTYTSLSENQIKNELNRYIGWPGQAVSYKIGEMRIRELREYAKDKLGSGFDVRSFNNETLFTGPVPMSVLERRIHTWVKQKLATQGAANVKVSLLCVLVILTGLFIR